MAQVGYLEPREPTKPTVSEGRIVLAPGRKYFRASAPKFSYRSRTGPRCCTVNCPSGHRKNAKTGFRAKVEKVKAGPQAPIRYRFEGLRMVRV